MKFCTRGDSIYFRGAIKTWNWFYKDYSQLYCHWRIHVILSWYKSSQKVIWFLNDNVDNRSSFSKPDNFKTERVIKFDFQRIFLIIIFLYDRSAVIKRETHRALDTRNVCGWELKVTSKATREPRGRLGAASVWGPWIYSLSKISFTRWDEGWKGIIYWAEKD